MRSRAGDDAEKMIAPSLKGVPLLGSEAVPDVDRPGDGLADLAGVVQHPRNHVFSDPHGRQLRCDGSAKVMRRRGIIREPKLL